MTTNVVKREKNCRWQTLVVRRVDARNHSLLPPVLRISPYCVAALESITVIE